MNIAMVKRQIIIVILLSSILSLPMARSQDRAMSSAPAFSAGVFVTPVGGLSFSAVVEQKMTQTLKDGTTFKRRTTAFIARDFRGRIHNESREVLSITSTREPALLSIHIYDPDTRLNTFLNPHTHIARQSTLPNPPATAPPLDWAQQKSANDHPSANVRLGDLGTDDLDGIEVHGYRRAMTLSTKVSGTDQPVVIIDEYWYSDELHLNMSAKHSDPRSGELTITLTELNRNEPAADLFEIPANYKIVDVTPPESESQE
ncbi:MAG: hypothetical protein WA581_10510 [Candidatus Acidiferrales bacterium]